MSSTTIRVGGAARSGYDVLVTDDLLGEGGNLTSMLSALLGTGVRRLGVIHPRSLASRGARLRAELSEAGYDAHSIVVPDGEAAKNEQVLGYCWRVLGEAGFTRSDAVVTLGGGSTTDLGGFVAASWLRGVKVVHVPTTLLAMVDAAVGGKTGINTAAGKNLVGAFHEPSGVVCDLAALTTLPRNELISGMAEVIKCGFIADDRILDIVHTDPAAALTPGSPQLRELVERAVQVKADVVSADLFETAGAALGDGHTQAEHPGRESLNYGHTLGHAIEKCENYQFRHGAAISIGMVFVADLAHRLGYLDQSTAARHAELLALVGLPTSYANSSFAELVAAMKLDKKARGDLMRFVILHGPGQPAILEVPDASALEESYNVVAGRSGFPFFGSSAG